MSDDLRSWEELSNLEQLAAIFWEIYKDAHGVRPRGIDTSTWTEQDFEREMAGLRQIIRDNEQVEQEAQARAANEFEARVAKTMLMGAADRSTAIKWIHEAENTGGDDEYLCYCLGLPYRYFREEPAQEDRARADASYDQDAIHLGQ
jgi:hypothetical protein